MHSGDGYGFFGDFLLIIVIMLLIIVCLIILNYNIRRKNKWAIMVLEKQAWMSSGIPIQFDWVLDEIDQRVEISVLLKMRAFSED